MMITKGGRTIVKNLEKSDCDLSMFQEGPPDEATRLVSFSRGLRSLCQVTISHCLHPRPRDMLTLQQGGQRDAA